MTDIIGVLSHPALQGISAIIGMVATLVPVIIFFAKKITSSNSSHPSKVPSTVKQSDQQPQPNKSGCRQTIIKAGSLFLGAGFLVPLSTILPPVFMILAIAFLGNLDIFQESLKTLQSTSPPNIEGVARFVSVLIIDLLCFVTLLLFSYILAYFYLIRRGVLYGIQTVIVFSGLAITVYALVAAAGNRAPINLSYLLGLSGIAGTLFSMTVVWATYYAIKKA